MRSDAKIGHLLEFCNALISAREKDLFMASSQLSSVTLSEDLVVQLKIRVAKGGYADESAVVREGLRVLGEREQAIEGWLRTDVVAAYDAHMANPSKACDVATLRAVLDQQHYRAINGA
jgi:antitoxin ParD1/3/4